MSGSIMGVLHILLPNFLYKSYSCGNTQRDKVTCPKSYSLELSTWLREVPIISSLLAV